MADSLPPVWAAEPHTLAKHRILENYLKAWMPILTRQARRLGTQQAREILYIDGFAGPGIYTGGEPGSPIIALKSAIDHEVDFPFPVRMLFVEHDSERFKILEREMSPYLKKANSSSNIHAVEPVFGECDSVLNRKLDEYEQKQVQFGPALAFLDQFGYGDVSMQLVRRIMSYPQCEIFSYLDYKGMNRFITDVSKEATFERTFGGSEWRACKGMREAERRQELLERYKAALKSKERGNVRYVTSFLMYDKHGSPLYWLIFCTNNIRGLEEMKKAMWTVDRTGEFRFSDSDSPAQLRLLDDAFDDAWLADKLVDVFAKKKVTASQLKEFVLTETPCYKFKDALAQMEREDRITVTAQSQRRQGAFADDQLNEIQVYFKKSLF